MAKTFEADLRATVERLDPNLRDRGQQDIDAVRRAGATSYRGLLAILKDPGASPDLRTTACWALARLGRRQAVPVLLAALSDGIPAVREAAAQALGELNDERAVQPLIDRLRQDAGSEVRKAAAYALGLLGSEEAVEPLTHSLSSQDEAPSVRGMAAEALADLRDPQAIPVLIAALRDPSAEVRYWAAFALGELGDPAALPELERVAATDQGAVPTWGTVGNEAAEAITTLRGKMRASSDPDNAATEPDQR